MEKIEHIMVRPSGFVPPRLLGTMVLVAPPAFVALRCGLSSKRLWPPRVWRHRRSALRFFLLCSSHRGLHLSCTLSADVAHLQSLPRQQYSSVPNLSNNGFNQGQMWPFTHNPSKSRHISGWWKSYSSRKSFQISMRKSFKTNTRTILNRCSQISLNSEIHSYEQSVSVMKTS